MAHQHIARLLALPLVLACHYQASPSTFPPPCIAARDCPGPVLVEDRTLSVGTVQGIVLNRFDTGRIVQAEVRDATTDQRVLTDTLGEFSITGLKAGAQTLRIRFLGYVPRSVRIKVPSSGGLRLLIPLEPSVVN